jgi:hypothetical protein
MRLIFILTCALSCHSFVVQPVKNTAARTALVWFHEAHIARGEAHDFGSLLSPPSKNQCYFAFVSNDVIQSVALCRRERLSVLKVEGIACHPDFQKSGSELVLVLKKRGIKFDLEKMREQGRWFIEALFLTN